MTNIVEIFFLCLKPKETTPVNPFGKPGSLSQAGLTISMSSWFSSHWNHKAIERKYPIMLILFSRRYIMHHVSHVAVLVLFCLVFRSVLELTVFAQVGYQASPSCQLGSSSHCRVMNSGYISHWKNRQNHAFHTVNSVKAIERIRPASSWLKILHHIIPSF